MAFTELPLTAVFNIKRSICVLFIYFWRKFNINASVTFAAAAVGSKLSTAYSNNRVTAGFPRSHTVAITYVSRTAYFEIVETENLRLKWWRTVALYIWKKNGIYTCSKQVVDCHGAVRMACSQCHRTGTVGPPYGYLWTPVELLRPLPQYILGPQK